MLQQYSPARTEVRRNPGFSGSLPINGLRPRSMAGASLPMRDGALDRDALFDDFEPLVQRLIRRYGSDPELREDLVGEIYFRFCALVDAYDPDRGVPLRAYLVRQLSASVFTYARHHWRLSRREAELELCSDELGVGDLVDPTSRWDDALVLEQMTGRLPDAISRLPQRQSQVLIWRYFEERSFDHIAEKLSVQPATVRSLLRHALNNLRRWFADDVTSCCA